MCAFVIYINRMDFYIGFLSLFFSSIELGLIKKKREKDVEKFSFALISVVNQQVYPYSY